MEPMTQLALHKFEEQIFLNTVLVKNETDKEYGTAFLMMKETAPGRIMILMFSNKHVFWGKKDQNKQNIKKEISFALHMKNEDGTYDVGNVREFNNYIIDRSEGYYQESDTEDVAALNISSFNDKMDLRSGMQLLDLDEFINYDYRDVLPGQTVTFIGYPSLFYDRKHTLPIMRKGTIASIPSLDFNGEKKILIDAQVFDGASGSPVFILSPTGYDLLGIIESTLFLPMDSAPLILPATKKSMGGEPMECFGVAQIIKKEIIKEVYDKFIVKPKI